MVTSLLVTAGYSRSGEDECSTVLLLFCRSCWVLSSTPTKQKKERKKKARAFATQVQGVCAVTTKSGYAIYMCVFDVFDVCV